jgi:serine/threonine-protein kinase
VDVYLDDRRLGRTPFTVELPAGRHRLRLTDRETLINAYRAVEVKADGTARLRRTFETSKLRVNAPPGSRVFLNGRFVAEAPMTEAETIYEGSYILKVVYEGMRWSQRFRAKPGRRVSFDVELQDPR